MPSQEDLKALSGDALWEFLKWLAFGQGRSTGVHIEPRTSFGGSHNRVRHLAEGVLSAKKQPEDVLVGIAVPHIGPESDDADVVFAIAKYLAARQIEKYRRAEDFDPQDAFAVQDEALNRIRGQHGLQ